MNEFLALAGDSAAPADEKQEVIDSVVNLNARTSALLSAASELSKAYEQLPIAHNELASAATQKNPVLTQIRDFAARAGAVRELLGYLNAAAEPAT